MTTTLLFHLLKNGRNIWVIAHSLAIYWTLESMARINGLVISPTYKWKKHGGYNPLILTINPNFRPGTSK